MGDCLDEKLTIPRRQHRHAYTGYISVLPISDNDSARMVVLFCAASEPTYKAFWCVIRWSINAWAGWTEIQYHDTLEKAHFTEIGEKQEVEGIFT